MSTALDDILSRWHSWARGYSPVPTSGSDPMFRDVRSGRGWDTTEDIIESELDSKTMKAVDFHVGELKDPQRTAIHIHARNQVTGNNVWTSPRLPNCPMACSMILLEAKNNLTRRLISAGIL
jgi:hypothetical protein